MDYIKLSKTISYILRHHPEDYNLELDKNGFVKIDDLLYAINSKNEFEKSINIKDINNMLDNSDKKRWEVIGDKIRAYYGHSFENIIEHEEKVPPDILYHGTTHKALNKILLEGLLPISRQFVHLSDDEDTAIIVGKRRDQNPVILIIDAKRAYEEGIKFMCENNHIWLSKKIDAKYIKRKL